MAKYQPEDQVLLDDSTAAVNPPDADLPLVDRILRQTQYLYALVLLLSFLTIAAWYSVYNVKKTNPTKEATMKGPGGKPLPITKKKPKDEQQRKLGPHFGRIAKNIFRSLASVVFLCYVSSGIAMFRHAFLFDNPYRWSRDGLAWAGEWTLIHVVGAIFFYLYIVVSLFDWRKGPNIVHLCVWILGLCGEIIIAATTYIAAVNCHFADSDSSGSDAGETRSCVDYWTRVDLTLYFIRIVFLAGMIFLFLAFWIHKATHKSDVRLENGDSSETTPLLNGHAASYDAQDAANGNGHVKSSSKPSANGIRSRNVKSRAKNYANGSLGEDDAATRRRRRSRTTSNAAKGGKGEAANSQDEGAAFYRPKKLPHKTWWEYILGYNIFFPYIWPKGKARLQLHLVICFCIVIVQRIVNMSVPRQIGRVVDRLVFAVEEVKAGNPLNSETFPLWDLSLLGILWALQGQSGLLGSARAMLWIPVSQNSYRSLTTEAFNHVHSLSLEFHLSKRTGEVLSALNKGSAINNFLEQVTFQVVPMLFDLILSIGVFWTEFGPIYAEINMIDTCWYLYMTIKMASTRADQRRAMTNADREEEAVKNDSISSYETVKYFNAEEFEAKRYREKVGVFQAAEADVQSGMARMNVAQALVFNTGRLLSAVVCGWQVAMGTRTTGEWFTIVSYLTQLQGPLNFFGSFYRTVQQAMISGERLLELFKIQPSIVDSPDAKPLTNFKGHIRWKNVSFAYQGRKPALRDISFEVKPGSTIAFVGESGGGKSTLFRHMFRYYEVDEGVIELDGKNVKDLTIDSVRRHIGVVPQDTTLFNETILYNLTYANPNATLADVEEACRAASIHDRIMSFPKGYHTEVGERGMRLSGGEKQRVAIARTILKNPTIIMLDEATSALDTHTEQEIQSNVGTFGANRTLLIIAHRLSTITHADQILVLNGGAIVERGAHDELLEKKGLYAEMWEKQCHAEQAIREAREAKMKANAAMRRAEMSARTREATSSGEDHEQDGEHSPISSDGSGSSVHSDDESAHAAEQPSGPPTEPSRQNA